MREWRGRALPNHADAHLEHFRELLPELRKVPGFVGAHLCEHRFDRQGNKVRTARAAIVLLACGLFASEANARKCLDDAISEVSDSGEILIMLSGGVYEVMAEDTIDSALWLPADSVLICERTFTYQGKITLLYEIINTDERGEKVSARLLR